MSDLEELPRRIRTIWESAQFELLDEVPRNFIVPYCVHYVLEVAFPNGCEFHDTVEDEKDTSSIAVVIQNRVLGNSQKTLLVIKCVFTCEERLPESLQSIDALMKTHKSQQGLIISYEKAIIFQRNNENDVLNETKEIILDNSGVPELAKYFCSLKPQSILDVEKEEYERKINRSEEKRKEYKKYCEELAKKQKENPTPCDFALDETDIRIWLHLQKMSKSKLRYFRPHEMSRLFKYKVFSGCFDIKQLYSPYGPDMDSIAIVPRTPRELPALLVVKFVRPSEEKLQDHLDTLFFLMRKYESEHGLIVSVESATIFHESSGTEEIQEIRQITLNKNGLKDLSDYMLSIKPRKLLMQEKRVNEKVAASYKDYYELKQKEKRPKIKKRQRTRNKTSTEGAKNEKPRKKGPM